MLLSVSLKLRTTSVFERVHLQSTCLACTKLWVLPKMGVVAYSLWSPVLQRWSQPPRGPKVSFCYTERSSMGYVRTCPHSPFESNAHDCVDVGRMCWRDHGEQKRMLDLWSCMGVTAVASCPYLTPSFKTVFGWGCLLHLQVL